MRNFSLDEEGIFFKMVGFRYQKYIDTVFEVRPKEIFQMRVAKLLTFKVERINLQMPYLTLSDERVRSNLDYFMRAITYEYTPDLIRFRCYRELQMVKSYYDFSLNDIFLTRREALRSLL